MSDTHVFVRPATSADAAPIGDIHARNMRASLTMAGGKALDAAVLARISPSAFVPAWRHAISAPPDASPQVFAAVEDGVVVGFAALSPTVRGSEGGEAAGGAEVMEMTALEISAGFQRHGHGSRLLSALVDAESTPLRGIERDVHMRILGDSSIPSAIEPATIGRELLANITVDAGGLLPERVGHNSWVAKVGEIDPIEVLEVNLCNVIAPFILINRLRPALEASPARREHIVNVSAMGGIFHRDYKGPGHPHTNMAKAALNMLTRTSAEELFKDRTLMTAVDTGWITDERPHVTKERFARKGFHTPLDLIDGAARVYHPIVDGENGIDLYGCFLKDYAPAAYW